MVFTEANVDEVVETYKSIYSLESDIKDLRGSANDAFKRLCDLLKIDSKDKIGKKVVRKAYKVWKEYHEDGVDSQSDVVTIFEMIKDK